MKFDTEKMIEMAKAEEGYNIAAGVPDVDFQIGMTIGIGEECVGTITEVTDERVHIASECFTGWATKNELRKPIEAADGIG